MIDFIFDGKFETDIIIDKNFESISTIFILQLYSIFCIDAIWFSNRMVSVNFASISLLDHVSKENSNLTSSNG